MYLMYRLFDFLASILGIRIKTMSKAIQYKTNMKRANSESFNHGILINAKTGEQYEIKNDNEVIFLLFDNNCVISFVFITFYNIDSF